MLVADLTPNGSLHGHNNEVTTFLLRRLMENAEFRRDFVNRFQDLLNTLFRPAHTLGRIDAMASVLAPEMSEHIRRWRAPASLSQWQSNVQYLRTYATNRPAIMREHLRQYFGLQAPCTISVSVSPAQGGTIRLNTLELDAALDRPWLGLYFRGHPITVVAQPRAGYRFDGWEGLLGVATNHVTLLLNGDLALGARFVPDPAAQPRFTVVRCDGAGNVSRGGRTSQRPFLARVLRGLGELDDAADARPGCRRKGGVHRGGRCGRSTAVLPPPHAVAPDRGPERRLPSRL
jgi:hypothetical protein